MDVASIGGLIVASISGFGLILSSIAFCIRTGKRREFYRAFAAPFPQPEPGPMKAEAPNPKPTFTVPANAERHYGNPPPVAAPPLVYNPSECGSPRYVPAMPIDKQGIQSQSDRLYETSALNKGSSSAAKVGGHTSGVAMWVQRNDRSTQGPNPQSTGYYTNALPSPANLSSTDTAADTVADTEAAATSLYGPSISGGRA